MACHHPLCATKFVFPQLCSVSSVSSQMVLSAYFLLLFFLLFLLETQIAKTKQKHVWTPFCFLGAESRSPRLPAVICPTPTLSSPRASASSNRSPDHTAAGGSSANPSSSRKSLAEALPGSHQLCQQKLSSTNEAGVLVMLLVVLMHWSTCEIHSG